MADITMCEGLTCPRKEQCYRYTASKNDYRQAYFFQMPLEKDNSCEYFTDNSEWKKHESTV
jgi:uncharacterized protein YcgL (UPF0745 family)